MTTRFYQANFYNDTAPNTRAAIIPATWSAGWNKTPSVALATDTSTGCLVTTLTGLTVLAGAAPSIAADGTLNHFNAISRFVSAPLAAQTISGNVKGQFCCQEALVTDIFTLASAIKVIKPDGSDRGVLLAAVASNSVTQPPAFDNTTRTNRKLLDAADSASIALSSLAVSDGDRLVFEVGFKALSTLTGNGTIEFANNFGADLPEDNTTAFGTGNSWIEFDSNITFSQVPYVFCYSSNPLDIATASANEPITIPVQPSNLYTNDLLIMVGQIQVATTGQITVSATGGQSWSAISEAAANDQDLAVSWCKYNGTFSAQPSLAFAAQSGTQPCTAAMIVVRDPSGTNAWAVDNAYSGGAQASATTVTQTGVTTTGNNNFILAGWGITNISTWGTLAGTNWQLCGNNQYRNSAGSDQSLTFAAQGQTAAAATNNVSKNPSTATTGMSFIMSWKSPIPVIFIPELPYIIKQAVNRASTY